MLGLLIWCIETMAETRGAEISPNTKEKQLGYSHHDNKEGGRPSALELESLGGLRTVEVGLSAEQVIKNEEFDRKERTRILRKIDYRLVPLLGVIYLYVCNIRTWSPAHTSMALRSLIEGTVSTLC